VEIPAGTVTLTVVFTASVGVGVVPVDIAETVYTKFPGVRVLPPPPQATPASPASIPTTNRASQGQRALRRKPRLNGSALASASARFTAPRWRGRSSSLTGHGLEQGGIYATRLRLPVTVPFAVKVYGGVAIALPV
jgi:hypothetical protein